MEPRSEEEQLGDLPLEASRLEGSVLHWKSRSLQRL